MREGKGRDDDLSPPILIVTLTDERTQLSVGHNHSMMELQGSDAK